MKLVSLWSGKVAMVSRFGARLAIMGFLLLLYYELPWDFLQRGSAAMAAAGFTLLGHDISRAVVDGYPAVMVRNFVLQFTPNCTYADLMLMSAPYVWRGARKGASNMLRVSALIASVAGLNAVRVVLSTQLALAGVGWWWAHDLVDIVVHAAVLGSLVLGALMHDLSRGSSRRDGQRRNRGGGCLVDGLSAATVGSQYRALNPFDVPPACHPSRTSLRSRARAAEYV